jgi:hypothetical protein
MRCAGRAGAASARIAAGLDCGRRNNATVMMLDVVGLPTADLAAIGTASDELLLPPPVAV